MLARLYERIHNKRKDFLHKLSNYYSSRRYDLIFLERLKVANLTKNHRLARKILDASWSTFKQMLQYKANRVVVEVEPAYTHRLTARGVDIQYQSHLQYVHMFVQSVVLYLTGTTTLLLTSSSEECWNR